MLNNHQLTRQLAQLVSFPTISGDVRQNQRALDYVETLICKQAQVKRIQNKQTEILLVGNRNLLNPDMAYLVHIDVVAAKPQQWQMTVKGNKAFGRGVSDMKFSIPIGVALLNQLIKNNSPLSFTLAITTDEEVGGFNGGKYLADELAFRPKLLIVPDGGDDFNFINKSKGVCQLVITASGKPAHASMPWNGRNALDSLVRLAAQLLKLYSSNNQQPSWKTTMNIGQIKGGTSTNQVCAHAEMRLDFRFSGTVAPLQIKREVLQLAKEIDSVISVEYAGTGLPTFTDGSLPVVKDLITSLESVVKRKIKIRGEYGASDARHFTEYQIPILMIKPKGGNIHGDNEWIDLDSCLLFYRGFKKFIQQQERKS